MRGLCVLSTIACSIISSDVEIQLSRLHKAVKKHAVSKAHLQTVPKEKVLTTRELK